MSIIASLFDLPLVIGVSCVSLSFSEAWSSPRWTPKHRYYVTRVFRDLVCVTITFQTTVHSPPALGTSSTKVAHKVQLTGRQGWSVERGRPMLMPMLHGPLSCRSGAMHRAWLFSFRSLTRCPCFPVSHRGLLCSSGFAKSPRLRIKCWIE